LTGRVNKTPYKLYKLSDGSFITTRQVADQVNISISAARTRLLKSDDTKIIFGQKRTNVYIKKAGRKPKAKQALYYNHQWIDQDMVRLMLRVI